MAVELADAYVSIVPSGRGLQQNIANQLNGAGFQQQGANAGNQAADGFGSKFGPGIAKVAALAAGALAAIGVGAFVADSVSAASDLNETLSKSAAIFGDQAPAIEKWGDTAAKSLGLSKAAALAAAAEYGDMFTQLGFTGDAAASMSKDVVQTAADLGSFNNLDTNDVLDRLSGAFRGEYDSLQAVIPNISAARVETEALAATGKKSAKELTAQEKAAAVLAIVHADGAKSAGDFAKTSNGLANQQKILSASFEDVKAKLGTALLPVLTKVGSYVIENILPAVSSFSDEMTARLGPAMQAVGGWVMSTLVPALKQLWSWVQEHIIPAVTNLASKIGSGLASAFDTIKKKLEENRPQLEQIWGWLKTLAEFVIDRVVPIFAVYFKAALEIVGKYIGFAIDVIGYLVDRVNEMVPQIEAAVGFVVAAWQWVSDAISATKDWIVARFNEIVSFLTGIPDKVTSALSTVWDGITGGISTAKQWVSDRIDDVVGFVTGMPNRITTAASGLWDGITSTFKSAINTIIRWWNNFELSIGPISIPMAPDIPKISVGTPDIPEFRRKGGPVNAGDPYFVGEGGIELFVPDVSGSIVPNNKIGGGGATNNFYMYELGSPQANAAAVGRRLAMVGA